ncbi:hypothetical protein PBRA_004239 [Plasmodiophora brassicae]|uniref:Chitin-binding type-1 domain-containing protein n=1 Tax=Plasmodiophora brassicae TaxID=37360 RepID=A0A0G4IJY2_PLABS|nr:hypothetical protein PBRA_004239 [Plasmodiophora brassicae]
MGLSRRCLVLLSICLAGAVTAQCPGRPRGDGRCGPEFGNSACSPGECCSQYGWCGTTPAHCRNDVCRGGSVTERPTRAPAAPERVDSPAVRPEGQEPASITTRLSVSRMTDAQWLAYREAMRRIMEGGTGSTYNQIAEDHGVPRFFCPHLTPAFLPWHRRYIARMEEALGMPIPYWDWMRDPFPSAFSAPTYVDASGTRRRNPLLGAPMNNGVMTTRRSSININRDSLAATVRLAMQEDDFDEFTEYLEFAHNSLHGAVSLASYDPIFWSHHAFVDRVWWQWQQAHPRARYPSRATGSLRDSLGRFPGSSLIDDFSGWTRGRITDGRNAASSAVGNLRARPELFLFIRNLPTTDHAALITVTSFNVTLGTAYNFGMKDTGMKGQFVAPLLMTKRYLYLSGKERHSLQDIEAGTAVTGFDPDLQVPVELPGLNVTFQWKIV